MNSITKYAVREANGDKNADAVAKGWLDGASKADKKGDTDKAGGADAAKGTDGAKGANGAKGADATNGAAGAKGSHSAAKKDKFSAQSVRAIIPPKYMSNKSKKIIAAQNQAKTITNFNDKNLNQNNVAYVINKGVAWTANQTRRIYNMLYTRRQTLLSPYADKTIPSVDEFMTLSFEQQSQQIKNLKKLIIEQDNQQIKDDVNAKSSWNNGRVKAQKKLDAANQFFADVANGKVETKKESGTDDGGERWSRAALSDDKRVTVWYDDDGKITDIQIYNEDKDDATVSYQKDRILIDTNHQNDNYEYDFNKQNNWEELVKMAEAAVGKGPGPKKK